jgi:DNA-binding NarL/FixJ family response regulator
VAFEAERRHVKLSPNYGSNMPAVLGDPTQLQQVVINLVVNAIEAVAHMAGLRREVRIETTAVPNGVAIAIADEGPGLSPEDAGRLFESTFTTKRENMGFGCPSCAPSSRCITGACGSSPTCRAARSSTCGFRRWALSATVARRRRSRRRRRPAFRTAIGRVLTAAGHKPRLYASAAEYLAREDPAGPACLIVDLRMPGPTGLDLQAALAAREDAHPVIFLSGHGDVPSTVRAMRNGALDFLTKPVPTVVLLEAIRVALERRLERKARSAHLARDEAALRDAHAARAPGDVGRRRGAAQQADLLRAALPPSAR